MGRKENEEKEKRGETCLFVGNSDIDNNGGNSGVCVFHGYGFGGNGSCGEVPTEV